MTMEKFHYTHDGKEIVIPRFNQLPFGLVRKNRHETEAEQLFLTIEHICDKKNLAIIDEMTTDDFEAFVEAWQKDGGVTVGESKS